MSIGEAQQLRAKHPITAGLLGGVERLISSLYQLVTALALSGVLGDARVYGHSARNAGEMPALNYFPQLVTDC